LGRFCAWQTGVGPGWTVRGIQGLGRTNR
jgi:hypothetical protein